MKGYKATYNFKCRNQTYKVGKTYISDKLEICKHGLHFCQEMKDVIDYYPHTENFILLEVEALGEVITEDNKSVTNKLRVLRVVPQEEYTFRHIKFEYGERGNMTSETHPDGSKWVYTYDEKGNKTSETHPDGSKWVYTYDEKGNKTSVTYPDGYKIVYTYDEKGNKTSVTYPDGYKIVYTYDEKGNKTSVTYPNGYKIVYTYDEKGNKTSVTYPDGFKYVYDVCNVEEID